MGLDHLHVSRKEQSIFYTCQDVPCKEYGVATVSRIDKIIGLLCRISSLF